MAIIYVPPFEDNVIPGDWRVEAMDKATGEIRLVIFKGENAEKLAVEYHAFKTGSIKIKVAAPAPITSPVALDRDRAVKVVGDEFTFVGATKKGEELVIRPDAFWWSYDDRRDKVTGDRKKNSAVRKGR